MSDRDSFDICIVGAGVIGLAIAYELGKKFKKQSVSVAILEKEAKFGQHISSRNSEVIHAGIYYPAASLKAKLCVEGKERLYSYCNQFDIPYRKIGKLIVAQQSESGILENLHRTAIDNGVLDLQVLDKTELNKREPHVEAVTALLSPSTGIIDSHSYMQSLLHQAEILGAQFSAFSRVERIDRERESFVVHCQLGEVKNREQYAFDCQHLINAAGLDAQSIAQATAGVPADTIPQLHYCKGDYFDYMGRSPFTHLIYPIPETNTAGLGIHATMDLSSQLKFGPDTEYVDRLDYEIDTGKAGGFAKRIATYFPSIDPNKLKPAYAGIRPKLVGPGEDAADFVIQNQDVHGVAGLTQLFGIESPGLTASLAIASKVAERIEL
jgi:L-2-hydroxyglutarate oxidase LhgO